jgi:hypothetical protein
MLRRLLASTLFVATLASCAPAAPTAPTTPTHDARKLGPASADGEVVGRWLLGELISPGGSAEAAQRARARLDELKADGMYASLARALDDSSHGHLEPSARAFIAALRAARSSKDHLAPHIAWYAINHLITLDNTTPVAWREAKPWVLETLDAPGSIGWRARGELVDWWSRHGFEDAEANLVERAAARYGCATQVRLAGPFGHGAPADRWRTHGPERPGPWPARWPADPQRSLTPQIIKTERTGCTVRADEPPAGGVYYAETFVDVPAAREVILAIQGSLAVWVDDQKVLTRDLRIWGVWPHFGVRLRLEAGRHRIVARLAEPDVSVRLLTPEGLPSGLESSIDPGPSYSARRPETEDDPNLLDRYLSEGHADPPADEIEAYLASYLAAIEGQYDVASVLLENLIRDQETATPIALSTAASFTEKDPIYPDSDGRDLARTLREKAVGRDPKLYFPRLWLLLDKADKGMPEAVRTLRAMVDEFPEVPELGRVLASLYGRLNWRAERAQTTLALLQRFPDDRGAIEAAIPILDESGKAREADALVARLKASHPDSEVDLDRALARHDYPAAIAELKRLGARRPDRRDIADRIASLHVRAGEKTDVLAMLQKALRRSPRDAALRLGLADARFSRGDRGALRQAFASALQEGVGADELRAAIELVEGATELEAYRLDTRKVIEAYEKSADALDGTAARVLDYSALWVHSDGSARMLEHEIIRVQSQEAIGKLAEQHIPQGALPLRMRVLKKNGQTLEPERVEGKPTVTMPHLEVGDYIETEHVISSEGDGEGGRRYVSPHWFFREADIAYWRSEFVVITPTSKPLVVETTGQVPPPAISTEGPLVTRRWRVDRSPAAPVEPGSVPVQEFLPSVRVGWGINLEGQLARMLDASSDELPRDPRLIRVAQRIADDGKPADPAERARRLYRWVVASVEDGRESDGRRVVVGKSGSRAAGFLYLARALGLPIELAVVRDRLRPRDEGPLASALSFSNLALRFENRCPPGKPAEADPCHTPLWFTVGDRHAPWGFLPAELRGQPAYRLVAGLPRDTTTAGGSIDGIVYDGKVDLRNDGSAVIEFDQRFVGKLGIGLRGNLEQLPEEQLKGVVESRLLARALPGARLVTLDVVDRDNPDKLLTLRMKAEVSDFARRRGNSLIIRPPFLLKVSPLAALETRQTPLLLPEATHSEIRLQIQLPKGSTLALPPRSEELKDSDRYLRLRDSAEGDLLRLDRVLDVPAGRVQLDEYPAFRQFTLAVDELASREVVVNLP